MERSWLLYEQAARAVLEHMRAHLGVSAVEGKQGVPGRSGTKWEIDAKALVQDGVDFLVVEARRWTTSLTQEDVAAIAYRIDDVGASGGIVVTPMPLQSGAQLVASAAGIEHVRLSLDSTPMDYLAEYMGRRFIGASVIERMTASDSCDAVVIKEASNDA
jgi:hypothetical protein